MAKLRSREQYEEAVRSSLSIAEVCRKLGLKPYGGNYRTIHSAIRDYNLDTSHFTGQGWNVGERFLPVIKKYSLEDILVKGSKYKSFRLKERLLDAKIKTHICESCGNIEWMGNPIPLELHHIDGDNTNNELSNIQLLCPNCHALTDNYRGKNIK